MKTPHDEWDRLLLAARRVPVDKRSELAPPGFATRVVAQAFAEAEGSLWGLVDRFSWRALALAAALAVASVSVNFASARQAFRPDLLTEQDPVTLLDLS